MNLNQLVIKVIRNVAWTYTVRPRFRYASKFLNKRIEKGCRTHADKKTIYKYMYVCMYVMQYFVKMFQYTCSLSNLQKKLMGIKNMVFLTIITALTYSVKTLKIEKEIMMSVWWVKHIIRKVNPSGQTILF